MKKSGKTHIEPLIKKDTASVLTTTLIALAEGLTGIGASKREEIVLSIGHIFQRMRGWKFLDQLNKEWQTYREKGRIKDDYQFTEQHQECLQELLDYLDKALPDEITFSLLKKIFLIAATEQYSARDTQLPQHYIRIIRKLSPGATLILSTTYIIAKEGLPKDQANNRSANIWLDRIAKRSGLQYPELIENYETELIEYKLITERQFIGKTEVLYGNYDRLTNLGYHLCDYINNYDESLEN